MSAKHWIIYNNDGTFILGNDAHGKRPIIRDYLGFVGDGEAFAVLGAGSNLSHNR